MAEAVEEATVPGAGGRNGVCWLVSQEQPRVGVANGTRERGVLQQIYNTARSLAVLLHAGSFADAAVGTTTSSVAAAAVAFPCTRVRSTASWKAERSEGRRRFGGGRGGRGGADSRAR